MALASQPAKAATNPQNHKVEVLVTNYGFWAGIPHTSTRPSRLLEINHFAS
jgi:hypothetical protein